MAEKPILFNTEMVKAILEDRKTQTRRLVKPKHRSAAGFNVCFSKATGEITGVYDFDEDERMYDDPTQAPFQPGDVLWVREAWTEMPYGFAYRADGEEPDGWDGNDRWYPSIHMPKEAARLFLRVTGVRCERLQEITSGEAVAEGIQSNLRSPSEAADALIAFEALWNSTVRQDAMKRWGWNANPWVWVIEFERIDKPKGWCES